ncbi:MAG: dethiobiotin synthase [Verrucomicrobia bacterium]|nr:dethiobiotin synthase [Verrucomicrobiota bacterium]
MTAKIFFITSTDTGVGKTVLTALLTQHLQARGVAVAAMKPLSSGGRADAKTLHAALGGTLSLDEINPWHFRAPLAPLIAARREGKRVRLSEVLACQRRARKRCDVLLIEGAGGLLSPLGEDFSNRELIAAMRAVPIVVCPNRLGAINQVLLVIAALPSAAARRAKVVLVSPPRANVASRTNFKFLAGRLGAKRVFSLPWLTNRRDIEVATANVRVGRVLDGLVETDSR